MHKKHSKFSHKDHHHGSRRAHVICRKLNDDSTLEVPQNSRSELTKRLGYDDREAKGNYKSKRDKHKQTEEVKSNDQHDKNKQEKKLICNVADVQGLLLHNESDKHKEKKRKRDKDRLNKIEKYLEGLNKIPKEKSPRNRSFSLESSESVFHNQEYLRREKTFHKKYNQEDSTNSRFDTSEAKDPKRSATTKELKPNKKHRHKESKERESSKEKNTKDNERQLLYCQVELESPVFRGKDKYKVERLYPEESKKNKEKSSRKRSSSRDSYNSPPLKLESHPKIPKDKGRSKEKKSVPIKFSPRRSKLKTDLRHSKDQRSNGSLGPYGKYFVFDKRSETQKEIASQKRKTHRKVDNTPRGDKKGRSNEGKMRQEIEKLIQEKANPIPDQYKEKIEDDIKSYFTRIQSLIDKKLDFILGNSNSKESKSISVENERVKTKKKGEKKDEIKEEKRSRDRSHSKKRKNERNTSVDEKKKEKQHEEGREKRSEEKRKKRLENEKRGQRYEDENREKRHEKEKKVIRESRRAKDIRPSHTSLLKRERYPSEASKSRSRRHSPQQQRYYEDHPLDILDCNKEDKHHRRSSTPHHQCNDYKMRPDRLICMVEHPSRFSIPSKTSLVKEKLVGEVKRKPSGTPPRPSGTGQCDKRDKSVTRRSASPKEGNSKNRNRDVSLGRITVIPGIENFRIEDIDPAYLQQIEARKLKKRMRQLMKLECKTVSIVGIPSQIRESATINETQTTTSLNAFNHIEDSIEKKKKSKRFKLYYKYSVADNKQPQGSDKSSEGKKTILSDSYRMVSDPSDHKMDVWENDDEVSKKENKEAEDMDLAKIVFVTKKGQHQKNCGDVSDNHVAVERTSRKHRKHSPKAITLNNILEEPSNISIKINHNETRLCLNKNVDCTFFNTLKSSSSDCSLQLIKKYAQKDWNIPVYEHRHPEKMLNENTTNPKSASKKSHGKHCRLGVEPEKNLKSEEKHGSHKKIRKVESHHKIKEKHFRDMYKYTSKSDINISYDSLRKYTFNKMKPNNHTPSFFREQLKYILPDVHDNRRSSPDRKTINLILKEELREILKEIPLSAIRKKSLFENSEQIEKPTSKNSIQKKPSFDDKELIENPEPKNKDIEEVSNTHSRNGHSKEDMNESHQRDCKKPNETDKIQEVEKKKYCSKKIGTHHATTKIPSLIKGYGVTQSSQIPKNEVGATDESNRPDSEDEISANVSKYSSEGGLIDVATEVDIAEEKQGRLEKVENLLENKKSQTPRTVDTAVEVRLCDLPRQNKHHKKVVTAKNVKRCPIINPFEESKVVCVSKPTRPILNLENSQFPNRNRPISAPYKRQKSNVSVEKIVKFEYKEEPQADQISPKLSKKRPSTAGNQLREIPPFDKFKKKPRKSALTMSTNIVTITNSMHREKSTDRCDAKDEASKKNIVNNTKQIINQQIRDKRDKSTGSERSRTQEDASSRSDLSLNDMDGESGITSLVCFDKQPNAQKTNFTSNSNSVSLDRYTTRSIIHDYPQSSRLFLTKSFSPQVNTYQRRKMYDESIRRKIKRRIGPQDQMGPHIFEVRYLTLENGTAHANSEINSNTTSIGNQKFVSKLPTFNTKLNKARQRTKPSTKKSRRNFPKNKEDACKFSGRDIFAPLTTDVDQLNRFRRKVFPEKKVEEIFVNNVLSGQNKHALGVTQSSSLVIKTDTPRAHNLNSSGDKEDKNEIRGADPNFKELIDCLYNSIISYCNTKFKLPQEGTKSSKQSIGGQASDSKSPPMNEKSYVIFRETSDEKGANDAPSKNSSSEGNIGNDELQVNHPTNLVCGHLSCPVLAGSSSSFEYLYEDGPIQINKDAVVSHFRKPVKTILGYAFNNTHQIRKGTFPSFPKKADQISNSTTESEESGYSSNNSKKCAPACNFFKRPSIANLFKPVKKLEHSFPSTSSLADPKYGPNSQEYDVMNQKCMEYAEKIRIQAQNKSQPEETFQEIPLNVLLLCRKSSSLLDNFNSNCSLCNKRSGTDLPDITEGDELSISAENVDHLLAVRNSLGNDELIVENGNNKAVLQSEIQTETLIFFDDADHTPSLEIITFQKSQTNFLKEEKAQLIQEMVQNPVVLSITNLNTCSLTVFEEPGANSNDFRFGAIESANNKQESDVVQLDSNHVTCLNENNNCSQTDVKSLVQTDVDGRSDISSNFGFRNTNSPAVAGKVMAKRFFENLLRVYEKEIDVTTKLFQDDDFFFNVLLESVKSEEISKTKNVNLKKLIKGKIKNYINQVFFSKSFVGVENGCKDAQASCSANSHQKKLQILAGDARKYFSMFVQAVKTNKDINDEIKICGLLKLLERIEDGDFAILRKKEEVDFEEEIKDQVKEAFSNIYQISLKEAKKRKRSLTTDDLKLIRTFVSKYRIGLLSKTDLIATYIGRGAFKTEGHLKAAVTYLIQQTKNKDIDLRDFDQHCKILSKCK